MADVYQKKYRWRRTQLDANDPPTDFDFIGFDGDQSFARIQFDRTSHMKIGLWKWNSIHIPWVRRHILPHNGWGENALDAARLAEEHYDRLKELHGR